MTAEQYREEFIKIEDEAKTKKLALAKKYAFANNQYNAGDIISDRDGSIKIQDMKFTAGSSSSLPTMVYFGVELKKDLTPKKNGNIRKIYQVNIPTEQTTTKK